MFLYKRTIFKDLIFSLSIVITISICAVSFLIYSLYINRIENEYQIHNLELIDKLSISLENPLWNFDVNTIDNLIGTYLNYENINNVVVKDIDNEIITKSYREIPGTFYQNMEKSINHRNQDIGTVIIDFNNSYLQQSKLNIIYFSATIIISTLSFVIIISYQLMKKFIYKPLNILSDGIKIIAQGDYAHNISYVKQNDINFIINEVNQMADKIRERDIKLKNEIENRKSVEKKLLNLMKNLNLKSANEPKNCKKLTRN